MSLARFGQQHPEIGPAVLSVMPGCVYIYDVLEERSVFQNRDLGDLLGYAADDRERHSESQWRRFIHPDDAARFPGHRERMKALRGGEFALFEYRMRHADGTWHHMVSRDAPYSFDANGRVRRIVGVVTDITEQKRTEAALRDSESVLRHAVDLARVWPYRRKGTDYDWPPELKAMWGLPPDAVVDYDTWIAGVHPDDRKMVLERIERALDPAGDGHFEVEYRVIAREKESWLAARGQVSFDAGPSPQFSGVAMDVTARKQAEIEQKRHEEHLKLLVDELNHRVKNLFASIQGLARHTLRDEQVPAYVRDLFEGRLLALASANSLLMRSNWRAADLADAVREIARSRDPGRFTIEGPSVLLEPKVVQTLSMALHELATNSVKYGALSNETGRVDVTWSNGESLRLRWQERGGPPVRPPGRRGFGTILIERALAAELHGTAVMEFHPEGLVCEICADMRERSGTRPEPTI